MGNVSETFCFRSSYSPYTRPRQGNPQKINLRFQRETGKCGRGLKCNYDEKIALTILTFFWNILEIRENSGLWNIRVKYLTNSLTPHGVNDIRYFLVFTEFQHKVRYCTHFMSHFLRFKVFLMCRHSLEIMRIPVFSFTCKRKRSWAFIGYGRQIINLTLADTKTILLIQVRPPGRPNNKGLIRLKNCA